MRSGRPSSLLILAVLSLVACSSVPGEPARPSEAAPPEPPATTSESTLPAAQSASAPPPQANPPDPMAFPARVGSAPGSTVTVDGIRCRIEGPETVPLGALTPDRDDDPADPQPTGFTLRLENISKRPRVLPLPELLETMVLVYEDPATGRRAINRWRPPPRRDGQVRPLGPGASVRSTVRFSWDHGVHAVGTIAAGTELRVCALHQPDWLRREYYAEGAFDWSHPFEMCTMLRVTR